MDGKTPGHGPSRFAVFSPFSKYDELPVFFYV
jgi:hypothetical protein